MTVMSNFKSSPDGVAITWLVSSSLAVVGLLCSAAFIYEKTRRRMEHPTLGKLTYQGGSWTGLKSSEHAERPAIRFELPGDKSGPKDSECEVFSQFWQNLQATIDLIRPEAIEELREIQDAYEDQPEGEIVTEIFNNLEHEVASFDKHWSLSEISKAAPAEAPVVWTLEFEVSWDIEHSRAAYLDSEGQVLSYNLSCAGSGLEEADEF